MKHLGTTAFSRTVSFREYSKKVWGGEVYFTEDNIWTMNDDDGVLRLTIMATLAQNKSK